MIKVIVRNLDGNGRISELTEEETREYQLKCLAYPHLRPITILKRLEGKGE